MNRFFCAYYNEATRLIETGLGTPAMVDTEARELFGVSAGPFQMMNLIGNKVALKAVESLSSLGQFYQPSHALANFGHSSDPWDLTGVSVAPERSRDEIKKRLLGGLFLPISELLASGVCTMADIDLGAKLALRFGNLPSGLQTAVGDAEVENNIAAVRRTAA